MEDNGPIVILYFCIAGLYGISIYANHDFISGRYRRWHTKQAVLLSVLLYGMPGSFLLVCLYEAAIWWAKLPDDDSQIQNQ